MWKPQLDEQVRLTHDMPQQALTRGDVGFVRSRWFSPDVAFEVEFRPRGSGEEIRAIVMPPQIEPLDAAEVGNDEAVLA